GNRGGGNPPNWLKGGGSVEEESPSLHRRQLHREPGFGGWACILRCGSAERMLSGSESETTNNRMELRAAIAGLAALKESCEVVAVTDSQYLQQGMKCHIP